MSLLYPMLLLALSTSNQTPIVVLDPGHGGAEHGASGICGVYEKQVTSAITLKIEKLIKQKGLIQTHLTRTTDVDIPLGKRYNLANSLGADLFVSIHANSAALPTVHGFETFIAGSQPSSERIAQLLVRENRRPKKHFPTNNTVSALINTLNAQEKRSKSRRVAHTMQRFLSTKLKKRNRGVYEAPFKVLRGSQMPAILLELGFMSNEKDCHDLLDPEYQMQTATSIVAAIFSYFSETILTPTQLSHK